MFLSPKLAIQEGWVKFPSYVTEPSMEEKYIQPNALDITIDKMYEVSNYENIQPSITEDSKLMLKWQEVLGPYFFLRPSVMYDVLSDFYVEIPQGVAAMLIIRSSFSRNCVRLSSGLYDSGFKGNIGFSLINHGSSPLQTITGTRVAQIAFVASDSVKEYAGGWNHVAGEHWGARS